LFFIEFENSVEHGVGIMYISYRKESIDIYDMFG